MTWTMPFTAIDGTPFTAAQYNTSIRDNLVETEASRAQTATSYMVTTGSNQIGERAPVTNRVAATETTTSTSFTDLDNSSGPMVTCLTGTTAFIHLFCAMSHSAISATWMAYAVSGASTVDPSDSHSIMIQSQNPQRIGGMFLRTDLTPGVNTFIAKYHITGTGTGTFLQRRIAVYPF